VFDWLRRKWPAGHPNREQAHEALRAGRCMYSPINSCSGKTRTAGLRHNDDVSSVLVCKAHFGKLRRLDPDDAERLDRELRKAFGVPATDELAHL
jgi:hypothetical protein